MRFWLFRGIRRKGCLHVVHGPDVYLRLRIFGAGKNRVQALLQRAFELGAVVAAWLVYRYLAKYGLLDTLDGILRKRTGANEFRA